jgi:DNA-binding MarR family transcriptional regulator
LVSRQTSIHHGRVYIISVTAKAEALAKEMMPKNEKQMAEFFSVFTENELVEYLRLNSKLAEHLKANLRKDN